MLNFRAENATFNGILIGSVVMTEILVWSFDAVSGPGTVPGPETASNLQTSISVMTTEPIKTPLKVAFSALFENQICVLLKEPSMFEPSMFRGLEKTL